MYKLYLVIAAVFALGVNQADAQTKPNNKPATTQKKATSAKKETGSTITQKMIDDIIKDIEEMKSSQDPEAQKVIAADNEAVSACQGKLSDPKCESAYNKAAELFNSYQDKQEKSEKSGSGAGAGKAGEGDEDDEDDEDDDEDDDKDLKEDDDLPDLGGEDDNVGNEE